MILINHDPDLHEPLFMTELTKFRLFYQTGNLEGMIKLKNPVWAIWHWNRTMNNHIPSA